MKQIIFSNHTIRVPQVVLFRCHRRLCWCQRNIPSARLEQELGLPGIWLASWKKKMKMKKIFKALTHVPKT